MADIFVSYTSSDGDWAFWIAKELDALGHTPRIHEWEIKGGEDIYAWMESRHDAADHVLCVVSDEYLKAPYSTLERNAALWQAAAKRPGFVLFVGVRPCRLPTLSDHIRRCELFGVPEDAARLRFREFMQKRPKPETVTFPGKVFAVTNVPIRVPEHFLGREDALLEIDNALNRYEGRVAITALHGLRGVGKTTLAAAYAERHRGDYRATWWIRAHRESTMRADLVGLGVRLNWIAADEKEEPALAAVMERLQHEGEGIPLIYDNAIEADALKPYLPRGGKARVLVTSNAHAWRGLAAPVEIRLWPQEIGADYLIARAGREAERDAALALSEALGGLPLAHEQAAAYCEDLGIGLAEYQRRFEAAAESFLDDKTYAPAEYHPEYAAEHRDRLTVAGTFRLAIEEAAKRHPAAEPLIVHAAVLAPEPIPLFLFAKAREKFGEPLASALVGDGLDRAVAALRAFALIDRENIVDERDRSITTDCIRLHRLVRRVAAPRRDDAAWERVHAALLEAVAAAYPEQLWGAIKAWPPARRLDAIALALVENNNFGSPRNREVVATLLDRLGTYRHSALVMFEPAQSLYERALALREIVLGQEHPETASSANILGVLLHDRGDFVGAETNYRRALAIRETRAPNGLDTATTLNNYAVLLYEWDRLEKGRELCERALAMRLDACGCEHPLTATSFHNLAALLQEQGDLENAKAYFERALVVRQKTLGLEHPIRAKTLSALGIVLCIQGNVHLARSYGERAQAIVDQSFDPLHPIVSTTLEGLACVRQAEGDFVAAAGFLERAVAIQQHLRPDHPKTCVAASKLARIRLLLGQPAEALLLAEAALSAQARMFGRDHRWTRASAQVLADALYALNRSSEAKSIRDRHAILDAHEANERPPVLDYAVSKITTAT